MLTASQSFKLYQIVQRYFHKEEDAQAFVSEIENIVEDKINSEKNHLVTKEDLIREVASIKVEIADLRTEMKEQKSEIIKWMFIFWVSQIAATLAIIFLFIKK